MEIRAGTLSDIAELAQLHARGFAAAWDAEFLSRLLAQRGAFFLLAQEAGENVGFVLARAVADEAEILSLGVVPESRSKGIGAALARAAVDRAQEGGAHAIFLEVAVENQAARALYVRLGFAEVGQRPNYYPDSPPPSTDALILRRPLPL
jgi:ribosomal-protein-alanine N-acetyltransferase